MLRFSLRNLILVVTLFGLVFAWFQAENTEDSHGRISSIDVHDDETRAVVCLLQSFQWPRKNASRFHRTICEIDISDLKIDRVINRGPLNRIDAIVDSQFWNSQARVVYAGDHVLFLGRDCQNLMLQELDAWIPRALFNFEIGEIHAFDSNPDGSMIVVQGITYIEKSESQKELDRAKEVLDLGESELREQMLFAMATTLGVREPETIEFVPRQAVSEDDDEGEYSKLKDSLYHLPCVFKNDVRNRQQLDNWRQMVMPHLSDVGDYEGTIGTVGGALSIDYSIDEISRAVQEVFIQSANYRNGLILVDADVASAPVRFAKLVKGEIILNLLTEAIPGRNNVDISVPFETGDNSTIRISSDGNQVVVSRGKQICFFDTTTLFKGYVAGMLDELKAAGSITVFREPDHIIQLENEVTTFDLLEKKGGVVVGDDMGTVKIVDAASTVLAEFAIPAKPVSLTKGKVYFLALVWGVMLLLALIYGHYHDTKTEEMTKMSDSIPVA